MCTIVHNLHLHVRISTKPQYGVQVSCTTYILIIEKDRTTYSDLVDYLQDIRDWQKLGMHILPGNFTGPIEKIQATHNGNIRECKKALFIEYMNTGDRSWKTLIAALMKTGYDYLAEEIKQKLGL